MSQTTPEVSSTLTAHAERLIRFDAPEDFRRRPGFRANLRPGEGAPFRIIGGYLFKKANWLRCGFSSCKRLHGAGYVIANANGLETNIGHCCGKTLFGEDWHVMYEQFETQRKVEALQDVLARVLSTREATLKQARAAFDALQPAATQVSNIIATVEAYGPVKRAFWECVKQRGSLAYYRDLSEDERAMAGGQKTVRETKGHIDGIYAATVNPQELARTLRFKVIVPLTDIQPEALLAMPYRQLEQRLREYAEMAGIVQQAEVFAEDAAKFAKPLNWHKFEQFCDASKVRMDHQGYKALRTLAGTL
jgi:hypothetical protein